MGAGAGGADPSTQGVTTGGSPAAIMAAVEKERMGGAEMSGGEREGRAESESLLQEGTGTGTGQKTIQLKGDAPVVMVTKSCQVSFTSQIDRSPPIQTDSFCRPIKGLGFLIRVRVTVKVTDWGFEIGGSGLGVPRLGFFD